MDREPTYEELEQKIKGLESEIDKRKQMEEALRESEKRFRIIIEEVPSVAVQGYDEERRVTFWNKASEKLYGYSEKESLGKKLEDLIIPLNMREQVQTLVQRWLEYGEKIPAGELKLVGKNGKDVPAFSSHTMIETANGKEMFCIDVDLASIKRAEATLQAEHARFVTVMDSLDAHVYAADMETYELIFVNKYVREKFGDVAGKTCWKALQTGQDGPCTFCTNDKLLNADGEPIGPYVWEFQNTINDEWYQCHDQAIRWPDGRLVRLEIATNIIERKRSDKALRQREQYLSGLNDAAQVLLVPTDAVPLQGFVDKIGPVAGASRVYVFLNHCGPDGRLLTSPKAEWCAEGVAAEIGNPKLHNFPYDIWGSRWTESLSHGNLISGQVSSFPIEEREFLEPLGVLAILLIPIMVDDEFIGFIGFDNCVSERVWDAVARTFLCVATGDLAQAIKRARLEARTRASLKEKEVLLREIHHRVKNNMQVIVSLLRMHSRKVDDGDTRLGQVFDDCRDRVNAMSLIHEALYQSEDLARIDFEVYLKKLCRNLSQAYDVSGKGISVMVERCNVALGMDQGIAVGMVISELIANAFKHAFITGDGGRVSVSLTGLDGEEIELIVEDDGKGLPPEIDIHKSPSLGLRLTVAAVLRELGGSIEVERDSGTRFIIHFKCRNK